MAVTVADLTTDVEAYQSCMSSNDQIEAVESITTLLGEVVDAIKNDNVDAWGVALRDSQGALTCGHIPVEWCAFQITPDNHVCTNQNGECIGLPPHGN